MKVFSLIALALLGLAGFAQNAEEIMDKAAKAMGAAGAKDVKTMYMSGNATMPGGITADMTIYHKEGGKILVKTKVNAPGMNLEMTQGCDGSDCYSKDPNFGTRLLEGQEKEMMLMQNDPKGQLDWRNFFSKIDYVGDGEVKGQKVHKIKVETAGGMTMTNAYDAKSFILLQSEGTNESPMGAIDFTMFFKDYKDVYKGMLLPMRTDASMLNQTMQMTIDKVEVNIDIPDSKFALPAGLK